jgi:formamidopyrimidine-DNA glycosylase
VWRAVPELPEVDHTRRQIEAWWLGRRLRQVEAAAGTPLRATSPADLRNLEGCTLRRVRRLGKHLVLEFSGKGGAQGLHLHLGMSGKLVRRRLGDPAPPFSKVVFGLADRALHFCDARRFGAVQLQPLADLWQLPALAQLGPDAWTAPPTPAWLLARLARVSRPLKVALLDQKLIAGLGNIQVSECLWRARISPFTAACALEAREVAALLRAIRATLAFTLRGLDALGDDADIHYVEEGAASGFKVSGREGLPCRRDGTRIRRAVQAARSTFDCPACQPLKQGLQAGRRKAWSSISVLSARL